MALDSATITHQTSAPDDQACLTKRVQRGFLQKEVIGKIDSSKQLDLFVFKNITWAKALLLAVPTGQPTAQLLIKHITKKRYGFTQ